MFNKSWFKLNNSKFHHKLAKFITGTSAIWGIGTTLYLYNQVLKTTEYNAESFVLSIILSIIFVIANMAAFINSQNSIFAGQETYTKIISPFMKTIDILLYPIIYNVQKNRTSIIARLSSYLYKNRKKLNHLSKNNLVEEEIGGLCIEIEKQGYDEKFSISVYEKENKNRLFMFYIENNSSISHTIYNEKILKQINRKNSKIITDQIIAYFNFLIEEEEKNINRRIEKITGIYHKTNYRPNDSVKINIQLEESKQIIKELQEINQKEKALFLEESFKKLKKFLNVSHLPKEDEEILFQELLPRVQEITYLIKNSDFLEKEDFKNNMENNLNQTIVQINNKIIDITEKNITDKINEWNTKIQSYETVNEKIPA